MSLLYPSVAFGAAFFGAATTFAFEGRIEAVLNRGGETQTFLYTVGANHLRVERTETNWPHAKNIVNLQSGEVTLLFPHNRSFVRLKNGGAHAPSRVPAGASSAGVSSDMRHIPRTTALPAMPIGAITSGIGPQSAMPGQFANLRGTSLSGAPAIPNLPKPLADLPPGIGPQTAAAGVVLAIPAMQIPFPMAMAAGQALELQATTNTVTLLGFPCTRYELKQRGEVLEIWATDKLLPFQAWLPNQPRRFGPRMLEEQWPELLNARKLFPLRASLRFENGTERLSFEVKSVKAEKIEDTDGKFFQPPPDYFEVRSSSF
jgi:hypothetical protein